MASCLFHRARTIAVGENIQKEEHHLKIVLRTIGYPEHIKQLQLGQGMGQHKKNKPSIPSTYCM